MAAIRRRTIEKPSSAFLFLIPGILFILIGAAIVIEPQILMWVVAGVFVLLGVATLAVGHTLRKTGTRIRLERAETWTDAEEDARQPRSSLPQPARPQSQ